MNLLCKRLLQNIQKTHVFVYLLAFLLIFPSLIAANQTFVLEDFDSKTTNFSVFNSFKYHLILIAFTQKNASPFDCFPNRYIFYQYEKEEYFELNAGNIKLNTDFSKLILLQIHTVVSNPEGVANEWKQKLNNLLTTMNVSALTLEASKTVSTDKAVFCWQQPQTLDLTTKEARSFPLLAANLCKKAWCSELYWIDKDNIRLWTHINPNELHLIQLDSQTGKFDYKEKSPKFFKKNSSQSNAPRDNIINKENLRRGSFDIHSKKGESIYLQWEPINVKRVRVSLVREAPNERAADSLAKNIAKKIEEKKYTEALSLIKFGNWLNPDNADIKYEKLKIFASLLLVDNLFSSLNEDIPIAAKPDICKKILNEAEFKKIKKTRRFKSSYKTVCVQ